MGKLGYHCILSGSLTAMYVHLCIYIHFNVIYTQRGATLLLVLCNLTVSYCSVYTAELYGDCKATQHLVNQIMENKTWKWKHPESQAQAYKSVLVNDIDIDSSVF